jgi:hypothetical protein
MSGSRSLLTALAKGVALTVINPAAAENVLRFTIGSGGAVTMDPHSRWTTRTTGTERPALQQVYAHPL